MHVTHLAITLNDQLTARIDLERLLINSYYSSPYTMYCLYRKSVCNRRVKVNVTKLSLRV